MSTFGVVLTASLHNVSTVAMLDRSANIVAVQTFSGDDELIQIAREYRPKVTAIGSPLGLPKGLDCLEESCACSPRSYKKGRAAERILASMSIRLFYTDKATLLTMKKLIYRGIQLKSKIGELGCEMLEVHPHANKVLLFGREVPGRQRPELLPFLKEQLPLLIGGLEAYLKGQSTITIDACDALINAYTAFLYLGGKTEALGDPVEEGQITVPNVGYLITVR